MSAGAKLIAGYAALLSGMWLMERTFGSAAQFIPTSRTSRS